MFMHDTSVIFAVNKLNPSTALSITRLMSKVEVIVVRDKRLPSQDRSRPVFDSLSITELETDYFDTEKLSQDIEQFRDRLVGVASRGESSIQYLARLSDVCQDWSIALPSRESLEVATDKQRMRESFATYCPEVTPSFVQVNDTSDQSMRMAEKEVGYPAIIKPANLASSLLIQRCDTPEQLREALAKAFDVVREVYRESDRHEEPVIIVEQMLEGELFSVDTYISQDGKIWHCPPVEYITGQSIGIDDFFLYKRSTPIRMSATDWQNCQVAVEQGVKAIGLRATTAHVELCKTKDGWKIIEIGPRIGRYRIEMYREAYGIVHSDNDVRVRLGLTPEVATKEHASCAAYSIYPATEGVLEQVEQFDVIGELPSFVYARRLIDDGSNVRYAKNGGHAIGEVILAHRDKDQFEIDCAWFEANVRAIVKEDQ